MNSHKRWRWWTDTGALAAEGRTAHSDGCEALFANLFGRANAHRLVCSATAVHTGGNCDGRSVARTVLRAAQRKGEPKPRRCKTMTNKQPPPAGDFGSTDGLGVCVIVNGVVVAWFAYTDIAEEWARENYFGRWLTWRASAPVPIPLTDDEAAECKRRAKEIHDKIRVE